MFSKTGDGDKSTPTVPNNVEKVSHANSKFPKIMTAEKTGHD